MHTVVEIVDAGILKPEKENRRLLRRLRRHRPDPVAAKHCDGKSPLKKQTGKQTKEKTPKTKTNDKASLDKKIAAMEKGLKKKTPKNPSGAA